MRSDIPRCQPRHASWRRAHSRCPRWANVSRCSIAIAAWRAEPEQVLARRHRGGSTVHLAIAIELKMTQELIIDAGRTERGYWRDMWQYRELFQIMAWRDVVVRYKQTVIGAAWALIRPFLMMVVFTVVFGKLAKLPSDGATPYALMVFAGMLPWTFFATGLSDASNSLVGNAGLISKVYFPRLIVPIAAT